MSFVDSTVSDGNTYRINDRKPEITAITPSDRLLYSHIDFDTLFLWRAEADELNLSPEEADVFFREKASQLLK